VPIKRPGTLTYPFSLDVTPSKDTEFVSGKFSDQLQVVILLKEGA
jgi:hypothetical protein